MKLEWIEYEPHAGFLHVENGLYIGPDGVVSEFVSGPRDTHVWRVVDGKIEKGLKKEAFVENFEAV